MIRKLSKKMSAYLVKNNTIIISDEEIYQYGLECMITDVMNIGSTILIGFCMHQILACLIFFIAFKILRSYAGGYHAKTQIHCYILSMGIVILALSVIPYIPINVEILSIIIICAAINICLFAPVEARNKPLNEVEKKVYRCKAWVRCGGEVAVIVICLLLHWNLVVQGVVCALVAVALSMDAACVQRLWKMGR